MMFSGPIPILRLVETYPWRVFGAFALVHIVVWTVLPTALYPNLPLDLIEALTYGPEWQLGYDKLPPLPWWLAEIVFRTIGHDFGFYLMAQLVVVAAMALVWATALPLVGPAGALVSVLIADGLHYFNFTSAKFNHDVIQLPFWALAGYSFHAAIRKGRTRDWLLLGLALGMAFWAKYFVVALAIPMVLFIAINEEARPRLRTPGPYIALAAAFIVVLPHLVWLIVNNFLPFAYVEGRAAQGHTAMGHVTRPLLFAVGQLFWLVPSLLIALPLIVPPSKTKTKPAATIDQQIVTLLVFGPCILLLASSLISGRSLITMWGYPFWLFIGLWLVMTARTAINHERLSWVTGLWSAAMACYATAFVFAYAVKPNFDDHYLAAVFPGSALAADTAKGFRAATGQPMRYVISDMWIGGNIHHYDPDHPRTLIDGNPARAPWIDLQDLRAHGAVVAWTGEPTEKMPQRYAKIARGAQLQPPLELPMRWGKGGVTINWAILKPQAATPPGE